VITRADGTIITAADSVSVGEEIRALLHRGALRARITGQDSGNDA
jgi:hypothetical protein